MTITLASHQKVIDKLFWDAHDVIHAEALGKLSNQKQEILNIVLEN